MEIGLYKYANARVVSRVGQSPLPFLLGFPAQRRGRPALRRKPSAVLREDTLG
jgi:hypothetical protein